MDLIKNLSIRSKLYILIGSTSFLMVVIGLIGLIGINQSKSALSSVYSEKLLRIVLLNEVRNQQNRVRTELYEAGQLRDGFEILEHIDKVRSGMFKIETSLNEYNKTPLQDDEKKLMDDFIAKRMVYGRDGVLPIIDLLQAEKFEQAAKVSREIMIPGFTKASDAIDALIKLQEEGAKTEYERIEKITRLIRIVALIGIAAGLTLSILLGIVITRSVSCGVREISSTVAKLANGELNARVNWESKDELGDVSRAFNKMAAEFSQLINQVRKSADQVTNAAQAQASTAEQVSEISGSQTQQADNAASSIESLNNSVKAIAQNTQEVVSYVNSASKMAEDGKQVVNRAVLGIQQVAMTVKESTTLIATLGQRSDQIGQIINVIKDIAEQTNLLALNAAIEAARAGEQGRGFAVVADEVRKLAERTSTATSEISEMITAIQSETANAVNTMEKGNNEVNDGVALANQAGEALNNINTSVKRVVEMIEQISDATHSQSESTNEITNRVEHIADMARQNTGLIEKTTDASHELHKLSGNLQQVVSRFKL